MRTFISIDLPREAIAEIERIQMIIKKKNIFTGKFTEPENLHITLKFLGEISDETLEKVKKALKEIKFPEFEAKLGDAGIFSESFIRIIWVKLNGKGNFDLQKQIDEKLKDIFPVESRFMSHITIARVKKVPDKPGFLKYLESIKPKEIKFLVNEFSLKKSELKSEGPVYSDIEVYPARNS
jgi:2'-5' RNA ligase